MGASSDDEETGPRVGFQLEANSVASSSTGAPPPLLKKKSVAFFRDDDDADNEGRMHRHESAASAISLASSAGMSVRSTRSRADGAKKVDAREYVRTNRSKGSRSLRSKARQRRRFWAKMRLYLRPTYWAYWLDKRIPIIDPRKLPRTVWDFWMLALVVYVCFMTPYAVGFGFHELYLPPYTGFNDPSPPPDQPFPPPWPAEPTNLDPTPLMSSLEVVSYIIDGFFWADLVSNFRTAYIDETATLIRDGTLIVRNYLKMWFWIDLLACLPLDKIVLLFVGDLSADQLMALMLLRTLRLLRLAKLLRVLERVRSGHTSLRLMKLMFFILICVHWVTCLWFFLFRMLYTSVQQPWSFNEQIEPGSDVFTYFLGAFYNTFVLMIGNNIDPGNSIEQIICCFVMIVGAAFYSIILGSISLLVNNVDPSAARHRIKRDLMHNTLRYLGMPAELVRKVSDYFDYLLSRSHPGSDGMSTLQQLPGSMFRDISVWMYYEDVRKVPLFQECEDAFIRQLVMRMRLQVYLEGEIVFRIGDVGHEMFFIQKGFVAVSNGYNELLAVMPKGASFGELGLLATAHRTASCTALCECDLSMLTAADLMNTMSSFPESAQVVREWSIQRLSNLHAASKEDARRQAAIKAVEAQIEAEEEEERMRASVLGHAKRARRSSKTCFTSEAGTAGSGSTEGTPRSSVAGSDVSSTSGVPNQGDSRRGSLDARHDRGSGSRNPSRQASMMSARAPSRQASAKLREGGSDPQVASPRAELQAELSRMRSARRASLLAATQQDDTNALLDHLVRAVNGASARVDGMGKSVQGLNDRLGHLDLGATDDAGDGAGDYGL